MKFIPLSGSSAKLPKIRTSETKNGNSSEPAAWFASSDPLDVIRAYLSVASDSEQKCKEGIAFLEQKLKENPSDIVLQTYRAGFTAVEAQYKFFPIDKFMKANEGIEQIESMVRQYPNHLEIRFIRLAVFVRLPGFFNKKSVVLNDAKYVLENLPFADISETLKSYVYDFLEQNKLMPVRAGNRSGRA